MPARSRCWSRSCAVRPGCRARSSCAATSAPATRPASGLGPAPAPSGSPTTRGEAHPGRRWRSRGRPSRPARRAHRPGRRQPAHLPLSRADRAARRGGHPPGQRRCTWPAPSVAPRAGGPRSSLPAGRGLRPRGGGGPVRAPPDARGRWRCWRRCAPGSEQLQALAGADAGAPPLGYRLPFAVTTPASAARLARAVSPTSCSRSAAPTGPAPETARAAGRAGALVGPAPRPRPQPWGACTDAVPRARHAVSRGRRRARSSYRSRSRPSVCAGVPRRAPDRRRGLDRLPAPAGTSLLTLGADPGRTRPGTASARSCCRCAAAAARRPSSRSPGRTPRPGTSPWRCSRWGGNGAVRLVAADPATWTMLLERLDADRDLNDVRSTTPAHASATCSAGWTCPPSPQAAHGCRRSAAPAGGSADATAPCRAGSSSRPSPLVRDLAARPASTRRWCTPTCTTRTSWPAAGSRGWPSTRSALAGRPGFEVAPLLWNRWARRWAGPTFRWAPAPPARDRLRGTPGSTRTRRGRGPSCARRRSDVGRRDRDREARSRLAVAVIKAMDD